ncbi:MAG: hypothetical protein M1820_005471 [Bogoriella megaspora]|nr:MAG: hypothetical protein M1820_005471 [Bogoriella megaspora]
MSLEKGLRWVQKTFSLEPQWTIQPQLDTIEEEVAEIKHIQVVDISLLAQGAFNKIYNVEAGKETLIIRVSLPVDPLFKTQSEVATLNWVKHNTLLPVPDVIAYQSNRERTPIGFEWILMTKVQGETLREAWHSMDFDAKETLVSLFAEYSRSVFRNQQRSIGNLYPNTGSDIGRIVSMLFFWGDNIHQDVSRGPFRSSREWMAARIALHEYDCNRVITTGQDEDDREEAERIKEIIAKLKAQLNSVFPLGVDGEPSMILHDDLSDHNILVNAGKLTGVVDWECVSAMPLWKACNHPCFLEGKTRKTKPDVSRYKLEANGQPNELYWEHLKDYELTRLRKYFLDQMRRLEPMWIEVYETSQLQRSFDTALHHSDDIFMARFINSWLDDMAKTEDKNSVKSIEERYEEDEAQY